VLLRAKVVEIFFPPINSSQVQIFPMCCFHQKSQRFAIGTIQGSVIVYDLRTATRWKVFGNTTTSSSSSSTKTEAQRREPESSDREEGEEEQRASPPSRACILSLAFSEDGSLLASYSWDKGHVVVWQCGGGGFLDYLGFGEQKVWSNYLEQRPALPEKTLAANFDQWIKRVAM
jgi:WD40 repeat protein